MAIDKALLDQLLAGRDPQELFARNGLIDELKKALSEHMLAAELEDHLETEAEAGLGSRRSGMTVRETRGHLEELYGIDVSRDLISTVTDAVLEAVTEWQGRPLDACYPLVFFDAIRVKIRDEGFVRNKAVYIALGILPDGTKEILGLWIEQTEGAKFWLRVMNELRNRGIADILIAVVDGLKGFAEAINAVFPQTVVQTCIVHLIRNSMSFASWKDRKAIAGALRSVYRAEAAEDWKRPPREWYEAKTQFAILFGDKFVV